MPGLVALLAENPLLLLFTVAAVGFLVGQLKLGGFSLGIAAVLFVGLAVGSLDPMLKLPDFVYLFGLVLFVYTIGLSSAPGFFGSLRKRGLKSNLLALGVLLGGAGTAVAIGKLLDLPITVIAGLFAGATTNTPALAGVLDTLKGQSEATLAQPVVGYSLAYPFGVLVVLATIFGAKKLLGADYEKETLSPDDAPGLGQHVENVTVRITQPLPEMSASYLKEKLGLQVMFGRLRRGDEISVVTDALVLKQGDRVSLVGDTTAVKDAIQKLGEAVDEHLELDRSRIDYRRIFVSNREVVERPLAELRLAERFGAIVTRIRRGDVEFVPTPATELELGDRVRVVAPRDQLLQISKFMGDSYRAIAEVDVISFSLGIGLGLLLGQIPIPLGEGTFKLGYAGGPLIAGLLLGRAGRMGPLIWTMPYSANLTLRQLGVLLFLAGIGTRSGWAFAEALKGGHALPIVLAGAAVTLVISLATIFVGHKLLRIPASVVVGTLSGIQTQPADLAFAMEQTKNEVPSAGYAAVYPVATIAKIILAQILLGFG